MEYKRLTEKFTKDNGSEAPRCNAHTVFAEPCTIGCDECWIGKINRRLCDLEDKIESGELISTKETGDTEIEFFVKHNQIVRKTVIKQFAKDLKEKEQSIKVGNEWVAIITDKDIDELLHKRYSIRLEEEADDD